MEEMYDYELTDLLVHADAGAHRTDIARCRY